MNDSLVVNYKYEHSSIEDTSRLSQVLEFDASALNAGFIKFANPDLDARGNPVEASSDRLYDGTSFDDQLTGDVGIDAHTLSFDWDINDALMFKSITGYRDLDVFNQTAQTPTTSLFGAFTVVNGITNTSFEQFSQEFQLLGERDTLNWVAGLYYYEDESEDINIGDSNGSEAIPEGELIDATSTENSSVAVFGQATWSPASLDDRWHFTVGARYSDDNRTAHRNNNRISYGFGGAPSTVPAFIADYDKDFSKFNPSFTVEYELDDFSRVYGKIITAYKSGGTSQRSTSHSNFTNGFTEEITGTFSYGYLDSSFGPDTVSYSQVDDNSDTGFSTVTETLTDDLAMAPKHSATLSLDYNKELSYGLVSANLNAQYQDETLSGVTVPTGSIDSRTLVGATLGVSEIDFATGSFSIRLWGKNLLDEEYLIGSIRQESFDNLGLLGLATFGDPRTYGLTLEYQYH